MGLMTGGYLTYCLLTYEYNSEIRSFHIPYMINFPQPLSRLSGLFYIIPTVLPCCVSSYRKLPLLGISIAASYVFTKLFYENYFVSVWCFFAAVLSAIILHIVSSRQPVRHLPSDKLLMATDDNVI